MDRNIWRRIESGCQNRQRLSIQAFLSRQLWRKTGTRHTGRPQRYDVGGYQQRYLYLPSGLTDQLPQELRTLQSCQ